MNLELENRDLLARLASMERILAENQRVALEQAKKLEGLVSELRDEKTFLEATLNNLTDGVALANSAGEMVCFNRAAGRVLGFKDQVLEIPEGNWTVTPGLFKADGHTPFPSDELPLARALQGETISGVEMVFRATPEAESYFLVVSASPVIAEDGRRMGAVAVLHDDCERKRWERTMAMQLAGEREKNELLERMQEAIRELSTPILELWDDVLALPVIGILDSRRSSEMTEQLLQEVVRRQARFVIIDITGVELVDTATADRLLKLVTAVGYIGARCILTGIRGPVAQTLAALDVDMGSLITLRTLKDGLRECLRLSSAGERRPVAKTQIERVRRA